MRSIRPSAVTRAVATAMLAMASGLPAGRAVARGGEVAPAGPGPSEGEPSGGGATVAGRDAGPADAEAGEGTLTLAKCLEIARRENLDVRSKEHTFEKSRLDLRSARAKFIPAFTLSASHDCVAESDSGSLGVSQELPWGGTLTGSLDSTTDDAESTSNGSITVSQPLLRGLGASVSLAGVRKARVGTEAERERLERTLQDVVYEVKSRYYEVQRALATVKVRAAAVARAERMFEEATVKHQLGVVTVLDLDDADIRFRESESEVKKAETRVEDALDDLKETLNLPLEAEILVEPVELELEGVIGVDDRARTVSVVEAVPGGRPVRRVVFRPVELDREEIVARSLSDESPRPDLAAARLGLRSREIDLARERGERRFDLDLSTTVSGSGTASSFRQSFRVDDEGFVVSLSATWPVGNVERRVAYAKAELDVEIERIAVAKHEIAIRKELRRVFGRLDEMAANILTYARLIKAAARAVDAAEMRREQGNATYRDVTERERELLNAQTSFINAYLEYQKQLAALDRASGVRTGWLEE